MPSLVNAGIALAKEHGGEVVVLTVVEVPEGVSLMAGRGGAREQEPLLEAAGERVAAAGVPVRSVVKIAHRVSEGILQTAREENCNFLLLGRPASASLLERLVASITERVLQAAPCQVGIVYGHLDPARVRGVVVPVTAGANPRLAASLGPALARDFGVRARAVTVVPTDAADAEGRELVHAAEATLREAGWTEAPQVVRRWDAVQALADEVGPNELVIIGAPSTDSVAALVGETVPSALVARGHTPLIVVRDVPARPAWGFKRFFLRER
jgi:nucleotide-binding universal stress UspA family protein